mgnify:CR=1 FL=1
MTNDDTKIDKTVNFSNLPKFKRLYNEAIKDNKTEFLFGDKPVLVSFAKYVIQYFESIRIRREL